MMKRDNQVEEIIEEKQEEVQAYIYLVKNPASNEVSVCSCDMILYPGTYVVYPTRYGMDMGVVIGNNPTHGRWYTGGSCQIHGACSNCPDNDLDEPELVAYEDYQGPRVSLLEQKYKTISVNEVPRLKKREEVDETGCWDSRYVQPMMTKITGDVEKIDRLATPDDMKRYYANLETEEEAMEVCREKVQKRNLDMKLVAAHFLLGEPKALFFFTAEDRVDFRDLVKDLVSVFRLRIELRQIGVRDEARVLGGLAICGRDFCCHAITDNLKPVSIKMAKEQNLSLNSMKISGPCGRLLCCLAYEYDFYVEEKRDFPFEGSRIKIGSELFKVFEINILSKKISLSGNEGQVLVIPRSAVFYNEATSRWEIVREYEEEFFSN